MSGELIDDRSLRALDDDSFGHTDFVRELAGIVLKAEAPSNVALFGPWGSGKTGIANLLADALPKDKNAVRFVLFDASKYAEAPLRRHFISQVASKLNIEDDYFHKGLYESGTTNQFTFHPAQLRALALGVVAVVLLVLVALLLVAAAFAGAAHRNFLSIVGHWLPALAVGSVVLTTVVKLVSDGLTVTSNRSAPSGDEEFENRFRKLVKEAGTARLVVFVDELDRCSPKQVASVLETLKTFLFVEPCVFVVAADQQVLEQALRREVRQHSPEDVANPYYSAGSSYLDKVFQYQLPLPPLKPTTLTRFGLKLTEGLPGVWQRIPNLAEVVSVLIPTHVVSPRRVKVLLNRYAVAFRLAERRAAKGRLEPCFADRATELAKLVCLQCEFPLFADDLTLDARLPDLVRRCADGQRLPVTVRDDVRRRAEAYARGERQVAEYLVDTDAASATAERASDEGTGQPDDTAATGAVSDPEEASSGDRSETDTADTSNPEIQRPRGQAVARHHALQLVNYLRKTCDTPGPGPDLLFLESAGADHGVDAIRAEALQRAAIDNDVDEVLRLVKDVDSEAEAEAAGALLVLADVVRLNQPGTEGRNAAAMLLRAIELVGMEEEALADRLADAIAGHLGLDRSRLQEADLLGALTLSRACSREAGPRLLGLVLAHEAATSRGDIAARALEQPRNLDGVQESSIIGPVITALLSEPTRAAAALDDWPEDRGPELLEAAAVRLKATTNAHYVAVGAKEAETAYEADDIWPEDPATSLASAFDSLPRGRTMRGWVLRLMLDLDRTPFRNAVAKRLVELTSITDTALISSVLSATLRQAVTEWGTWLSALDPESVALLDDPQQAIGALNEHLWSSPKENSPPSQNQLVAAIEALGAAASYCEADANLRQDLESALGDAFSSDAVVESQRLELDLAELFVNAGLLARQTLAEVTLEATATTLTEPLTTTSYPPTDQVAGEVLRRVKALGSSTPSNTLRRVWDAARESSWFDGPLQLLVLTRLAVLLRGAGQLPEKPLSSAELTAVAGRASSSAVDEETLSVWLDEFAEAEPIAEVFRTLGPMYRGGLPSSAQQALDRYVERLGPDRHFEFVNHALGQVLDGSVDEAFLGGIGLHELDQARLANRLVELYNTATNLPARRKVVELWTLMRPTSPTAQKRLTERVYIPLVGTGDGALDYALAHFSLVSNVSNVRNEVRMTLRAAAKKDQHKKRVERTLEGAGWRAKRLGGLGGSRDV